MKNNFQTPYHLIMIKSFYSTYTHIPASTCTMFKKQIRAKPIHLCIRLCNESITTPDEVLSTQ